MAALKGQGCLSQAKPCRKPLAVACEKAMLPKGNTCEV